MSRLKDTEAALRSLTIKVDWLADTCAEMCDGSVFRTMACREVEALADVLRATGRNDVADAVIADHADYDQPGDDHYAEGEKVW
jgi:hypothetical protein